MLMVWKRDQPVVSFCAAAGGGTVIGPISLANWHVGVVDEA